jgi:hypothetical protein
MDQLKQLKHKEDIITIAGGVEIEVTHLDGTIESVKVRQIPATRLEEFMTRLADESTSVRIYCDKEDGWADTLTHESVSDICNKGYEINESFLNAWCLRRAKWTEMMNVGIIADLQKKLASLNEALASVSSSQKSRTGTDLPPRK